MSDSTFQGASNNERLLAAARTDNEELLVEVFEGGDFDVNCTDGLGNTPLHAAVAHGSTDVLEHILSHEYCDVDPINKLEGATPLHLAIRIEHKELRKYIIESLLDAGANVSVKDKNGETILDILPVNETEIRELIRKAQAQDSIALGDIASDDEGPGGPGSGSEED